MTASGRPRLLDLFCCEGGAATGYHRAGFDVFGVDVNPKALRRYPFPHHHGDALQFLKNQGHEFDAIHASPPCKSETVLNNDKSKHEDFLTPTLAYLREVDTPWIVENVVSESTRAKMPGALMLCGGAFGLGANCQDGKWRPLRRHRLFESNVFILGNGCACSTIQPVGVYGNGGGCASNMGRGQYQASAAEAREAIGAPWMSRDGVSQSIPPAYTQFLGEQLIEHCEGPWA